MNKNTPTIILVNPQMGENIGAAARAMLNFGIANLRIVNPRDGWPNQRAVDMSSGALEIMPDPKVFDTLEDAIADLNYVYATTARPRDMVKPVFTPDKAAQDSHVRQSEKQRIGFVFGAERTGLTNDETALCPAIINIPTNPDFSSLNLAQAVLLVCYAYHNHADQSPEAVLPTGDSQPAKQEQLENFLCRLEDELEDHGFFRSEGLRPTMVRNIRNMIIRAELTEQEVNTYQGILSALIGNKKAAE